MKDTAEQFGLGSDVDNRKTVTKTGQFINETLKAVLFSFRLSNGKMVRHWIPKSQMESLVKSKEQVLGDEAPDRITITHWIAQQKELV